MQGVSQLSGYYFYEALLLVVFKWKCDILVITMPHVDKTDHSGMLKRHLVCQCAFWVFLASSPFWMMHSGYSWLLLTFRILCVDIMEGLAGWMIVLRTVIQVSSLPG
jgi:fucose 4-O-acetylase-like acetyltransferase